ncbi:MAG: hypothetical protein QOF36_1147, partial [Microbacteriaceae bacterium]|nr:hypothetical protein [Microbacteriaceae bacterium]
RLGAGLGGQVLALGRPRSVEDYLSSEAISRHYFSAVAYEGLGGMACVPIYGAEGIKVLLYACLRGPGALGDVAIDQLRQIASQAGVALHHVAARARDRELAVLRERQRLATALHDSVAQMLFAIGVAAQQSRAAADPNVLAAAMLEIETTAASARQELRDTFARLSQYPEGAAFEALFEAEVRLFERQTGIRVSLTLQGEPQLLPEPTEELIIDTAREGFRNVHKHASSMLALANLRYEASRVVLSIQSELAAECAAALSNPAPDGAAAAGSGLGVLRGRAERLRGGLSLDFRDDDVAVLRLEVPIRPPAGPG